MDGTEHRATVIIPTFGEARFVEWAVRSVQDQTIQDLEICVICDGSPPDMVRFLRDLCGLDPRVQILTYPKSPRTGEPYRDEVIRGTSGTIICYCGHDDLWLPDHVESVEQTLSSNHFTNSIHASVNTPEEIRRTGELFLRVRLGDLEDPASLTRLRGGSNFFGLTYGAHTRAAYLQLPEGWVTTPSADMATDLYMWKKFVDAFPKGIATTHKITALNFALASRQTWPESRRSEELKSFYEGIHGGDLVYKVREAAAEYLQRRLRDQTRKYDSLKRECGPVVLRKSSPRYLLRRLHNKLSGRLRARVHCLLRPSSKRSEYRAQL